MTGILAVDFDGTLCENKYPDIGQPRQNVIDYVKKKQADGWKVVLWTCRTKKQLYQAVHWCKKLCNEYGVKGTDLITFSECLMSLINKYADLAEEENNE